MEDRDGEFICWVYLYYENGEGGLEDWFCVKGRGKLNVWWVDDEVFEWIVLKFFFY